MLPQLMPMDVRTTGQSVETSVYAPSLRFTGMMGRYWSAAPTAPAPALNDPSVGTMLLFTRLTSRLLDNWVRLPISCETLPRSEIRLKSEP